MSIKERIIKIIELKEMSVRSFQKACNLSEGFVKNIKGTITVDKMGNILHAFPDINANWLITGIGEPLINLDDVNALAQAGKDYLEGIENGFANFFAPMIINDRREQRASGNGMNLGDVFIHNDTDKTATHEIELLKSEVELLKETIKQLNQTIEAKNETIASVKANLVDKEKLISILSRNEFN